LKQASSAKVGALFFCFMWGATLFHLDFHKGTTEDCCLFGTPALFRKYDAMFFGLLTTVQTCGAQVVCALASFVTSLSGCQHRVKRHYWFSLQRLGG
jgi:hypothetical protein